jgi:ATP-dependent Clp protease ATP-binding subunit ClpA
MIEEQIDLSEFSREDEVLNLIGAVLGNYVGRAHGCGLYLTRGNSRRIRTVRQFPTATNMPDD